MDAIYTDADGMNNGMEVTVKEQTGIRIEEPETKKAAKEIMEKGICLEEYLAFSG